MIAKELLHDVQSVALQGDLEINILGLAIDSREVKKGYAFFAFKGLSTDGHLFIESAINQGACLIVCENLPQNLQNHITYVQVNDCKKAVAIAAANFYKHPSQNLKLVGITGTNGKTTVATLCFQLFKSLGYKTGLLSTVQNIVDNNIYPATHTTSDAIQVNKMLRLMVDAGCEYAFMEVSSHAIDQDRTYHIQFAGGVFTNISHDHLDYHETFMNYIYAKKKFFDQLPASSFALVNADDKRGEVMLQNCQATHYKFALKTLADFHTKIIESDFNGLVLSIDGQEVHTRLVGYFNAYNLITTYGIARLLDLDSNDALRAISIITGAEGRFDWIKSKRENLIGVIDYAHTPDALQNVLSTARDAKKGTERLITVFGCGGDRDKEKRPKMAQVATELSDLVIITSDNPRTEDPASIIEDIKVGVRQEYLQKTLVQIDRKEAIRMAVAMAHTNDIIMIAGKGHEKYQEINGEKFPFDDKAILQDTFKEMNK